MTAKTILVQLHHKIETFERMNKHLVLVAQDHLIDYMSRQFSFGHLNSPARLGDPMHFHSYRSVESKTGLRLALASRCSTDVSGIAACLGLQPNAEIDIKEIVVRLESLISDETLLSI